MSIFRTRQDLSGYGFKQLPNSVLILSGNTFIGHEAALKYEYDESQYYDNRSIPDVEYVHKKFLLNDVGEVGDILFRDELYVTGATNFKYDKNRNNLNFGINLTNEGTNSVILGGENNIISTGNTRTILLGGENISILSSDYDDTTIVANLAIMYDPEEDILNNNLLVWDYDSGKIKKRNSLSLFSHLDVINGISKHENEYTIKLGGELIENTTLSGNYDLRFRNLSNFSAETKIGNIIIDAQNDGGVLIKSQYFNHFGNTDFDRTLAILMDYSEVGGFKLIDNRNGGEQKGIEYAGDYSTNYTNRSLIDKGFLLYNKNIIDIYINTEETYQATTENHFILTDSGSVIILPNLPKLGQVIIIGDNDGGAYYNNINIISLNYLIRNNTNCLINTNYGVITLIFNGSYWSIVSFSV